METETQLLIWIPIAFVVLFSLIWSSVLFLISYIAGWNTIASSYPDGQPPEKYDAYMTSGRIGFSGYSGVLKLHAGSRGLHMAVILPFRPGHPPACIPWHALRLGEKTGILIAHQQLAYARTFLSRSGSARKLRARTRFRGDRPSQV